MGGAAEDTALVGSIRVPQVRMGSALASYFHTGMLMASAIVSLVLQVGYKRLGETESL